MWGGLFLDAKISGSLQTRDVNDPASKETSVFTKLLLRRVGACRYPLNV
jgi:hypothetical protein